VSQKAENEGSRLGTRLLQSPYCDHREKGCPEREKYELEIYLLGVERSLELSCPRAGIKP